MAEALTFDASSRTFANGLKLAFADIAKGIEASSLWSVLAWQDIRQRYRRSVLGPFWLTISTGVMVVALGVVYAGLFHDSIERHLPFVAVGMTVWAFISAVLNESCATFVVAEGMMKQTRLPLSIHVYRMVWRNVIIFGHNALILLIVYWIYGPGLRWQLLQTPLALAVLALNGVWIGLVFGIVCARFRDVGPILANFVQLSFFVTPIMWRSEQLGPRAWIAHYNPFYHAIEILRAPLMGLQTPLISWAVVLTITLVGFACALLCLARFRHRVVYWV